MSVWTTPLPRDSLPAQHFALRAEQARALAAIVLETDGAPPQLRAVHTIGDWEQLRGLPAIGRGVQGAIRHTRPGDSLR